MDCVAFSASDYHVEVAMLPDRSPSEDDACPVRDELLAEIYGASKLGLSVLVATVAPDIRAMLALYCYHRSHLHSIGLVIAASCEEDDLVQSGGRVGAVLFARSREAPQAAPVASHYTTRRKVTLASGPFCDMPAFDQESDDEAGPAVRAL
jgi:hypothetical protein